MLCTNQTLTCTNVHPHKQRAYPLPCFDFSRSLSFLWSLCLCSFSLYLSLCLWESERENGVYLIPRWRPTVRNGYSARAKSKMIKAKSTLKWQRQTMYTPTSESRESNQPTSRIRSAKIHPRCSLTQSRNHISKSQVPSIQHVPNVMRHLDWMYT